MLDSMFFCSVFFMNRTVRPQSLQFVCCLKCSLVVGFVRNFFYQLRITSRLCGEFPFNIRYLGIEVIEHIAVTYITAK